MEETFPRFSYAERMDLRDKVLGLKKEAIRTIAAAKRAGAEEEAQKIKEELNDTIRRFNRKVYGRMLEDDDLIIVPDEVAEELTEVKEVKKRSPVVSKTGVRFSAGTLLFNPELADTLQGEE